MFPKDLCVVANEKEAFRSLSTTVANFIYINIFVCQVYIRCMHVHVCFVNRRFYAHIQKV